MIIFGCLDQKAEIVRENSWNPKVKFNVNQNSTEINEEEGGRMSQNNQECTKQRINNYLVRFQKQNSNNTSVDDRERSNDIGILLHLICFRLVYSPNEFRWKRCLLVKF